MRELYSTVDARQVTESYTYWLTYLENCIVRGARAKHRANTLHRRACVHDTRIFTTWTSLTLIKYIIPFYVEI